jgi:hypothetical protein
MPEVRHRAALAALACVCVLAACDDAPPDAQQTAPVASQKVPAPKVANLAKDMVAAVSAGKTSRLIGLHFALRAAPSVNTPLPIEVAIVPHSKFASISVHFESQEGLAVATGEKFGPVTDGATETAIAHQLILLPTKEGMFMVTSVVETDGEDGNVTRIFSIPVIVAPEAATPAATPAGPPAAQPAKN